MVLCYTFSSPLSHPTLEITRGSKYLSQTATMFLKCFGNSSSSKRSKTPYPTVIQELCHQFSLTLLRKSTHNFDHILGRGGFGEVYKGCLQRDDGSDYTVAVKCLSTESSDQEILRFKNEIVLLCQLRHPNLVSLIGFCDEQNEKCIVYEYMSNGTLNEKLQVQDTEKALSWKKRLEICIGAARGLHYLHAGAKRTIIHRNIKPGNILLDDHMEPKLGGFSLSIQGARFMSKPKPIQVDVAGTVGYIPLEYWRDSTISDKTDVYSFGMVLLDVVRGNTYAIHRQENSLSLEEKIDPNIKGKIAPECWQVVIDIMQRCLKCEADERPTMGEVEVELELALSLQQQADITNTNANYALFSTTTLDLGWMQEVIPKKYIM